MLENGDISLELEDNNEYDPSAVRVLVKQLHVGYVSRDDAPYIRQLLKSAMHSQISIVALY